MKWSESVLRIAQQNAQKFSGVQEATDATVKAVKELPEYREMVKLMIYDAMSTLVGTFRHQLNVAIKNGSKGYDNHTKVRTGSSRSFSKACLSVFNYCIAGTRIGLLRGEDLPNIAESERSRSNGHAVNASVIEHLIGVVPKNKTVQEAIP